MTFTASLAPNVPRTIPTQRPKPPSGYRCAASQSSRASSPGNTRNPPSSEMQSTRAHPPIFIKQQPSPDMAYASLDDDDAYGNDAETERRGSFIVTAPSSSSSLLANVPVTNNWTDRRLSYELDTPRDALDDCCAKCRRAQNEAVRLSEAHAKLGREHDHLLAELHNKQTVIAQLEQEARRHKNELESSNERLQQLTTDNTQLNSALADAHKATSKGGGLLRQTQLALADAQQRLEHLEAEKHEWSVHRYRMEQRIKASESELRQLRREHSAHAENRNLWQSSICTLVAMHRRTMMPAHPSTRQLKRVRRLTMTLRGGATMASACRCPMMCWMHVFMLCCSGMTLMEELAQHGFDAIGYGCDTTYDAVGDVAGISDDASIEAHYRDTVRTGPSTADGFHSSTHTRCTSIASSPCNDAFSECSSKVSCIDRCTRHVANDARQTIVVENQMMHMLNRSTTTNAKSRTSNASRKRRSLRTGSTLPGSHCADIRQEINYSMYTEAYVNHRKVCLCWAHSPDDRCANSKTERACK
ncbi:hypothetical protein SYNPS1DRAFT_30312 [Syncephalis pseudoplumigaleata]|uniref:Uncharacterized protein n=1 Tax=Syncephalis pseudoplumigaleata TaxID=1712513 RepID=A0A4P9YY52_9FUNG|nr:hypothetical protein SYNPS1DRAFT_30312 [Syncephalis pseudoplumigaleata]|eukprot:RKP23920.1 hypothetical protein SYNPS1DRAFT_30312 [Syncephalis pseudoplumigaleata]